MAENEYELKSARMVSRGNSLFKTDYQDQLFRAIRQRNINSAERILNSLEVDVNFVYDHPYYKTCLDYACSTRGMSEYVKLLIKHKADINKFNNHHNRAPIHFAAEIGDVENVKALIKEKDLYVNSLCSGNNTALHLAIKEIENIDDDRDYYIKKYEEVVKILTKDGADVNIPDNKCFTPVHTAAQQGLENVVKILLEYSKTAVDLDSFEDLDDKTARMILEETFPHLLSTHAAAAKQNRVVDSHKLLSYLFEGNEDRFVADFQTLKAKDQLDPILTKNDGDYTFMQLACKKGYEKVVNALLKKGADPNATAIGNSMRPIGFACRGGYDKILELLVKNPSTAFDPIDGESLVQLTIRGEEKCGGEEGNYDYKACLRILLNSKEIAPNINYIDVRSNTALHYATKSGDQDVVLELLRNGAYLGARNKFNDSPLVDISHKTLKIFLDECLTTNGMRPNNDNFEMRFNYGFLVPPDVESEEDPQKSSFIKKRENLAPETDVLLTMAKDPDLKYLLKHPVITSFLYLKWNRISFLYYLNTVFYTLFWLSLIFFILLEGKKEASESAIDFLRTTTTIGVVFLTCREAIQMLVTPKKYWMSFENILEVLLIVTCYSVFFTTYFKRQELYAVAILLSSAELILLIGKFPSLSTYIVMLKTVSWNFLKFLLWYCILIIAFALCFYTLFRNEDDTKGKEDYDETKPFNPNKANAENDDGETDFFLDPGMSLFKTIVMLTGEFDAAEINFKYFPITSHIIFIIFVFMIPIVLFNLLNGLAVSDTQAIKSDAELVSHISRIHLMSYFESILLGDMSAYKNTVSNVQNRCCWLPGHSCIKSRLICVRPLAERICLFPKYLPTSQIHVKVNQAQKIEIVKEEKTNKAQMEDVDPESAMCCVRKCLDIKMGKQIVKAAKVVLTEKGHGEDDEIKDLRRKIDNLEKLTQQLINHVKSN